MQFGNSLNIHFLLSHDDSLERFTYRASVFESNALQRVGFAKLMPDEELVVSDVIAGAAVLLKRSTRISYRLLLAIEKALVLHVGNDFNKLNQETNVLNDY